MERMEQPFGLDHGLEGGRGAIRALVIEGVEYTASLLAEMPAAGGLIVESVRGAREALCRLRADSYDVIVATLPVTQMTAEDFFRGIAALDVEYTSRVVFLASDIADPSVRRFLTFAGRPFLTRPVDAKELHELVMRVGLGHSDA